MSPTRVFAARVKQLRKRQNLSQQELSDRLAELGWPIHRLTIAKIEKGADGESPRANGVTLNDVLAFSAALSVSPVYLMTPLEDENLALSIGNESVPPSIVQGWIRGDLPLRSSDLAIWIAEQPERRLRERIERTAPPLDPIQQQLAPADIADAAERAAVRGLRNDVYKAKEESDG